MQDNAQTIISRLDRQDKDLTEIKDGVKSLVHVIHGNGTAGIKTELALLKTAVQNIEARDTENRVAWKGAGWGQVASLIGTAISVACAAVAVYRFH